MNLIDIHSAYIYYASGRVCRVATQHISNVQSEPQKTKIDYARYLGSGCGLFVVVLVLLLLLLVLLTLLRHRLRHQLLERHEVTLLIRIALSLTQLACIQPL